jgi:hypothetical protein
LIVSIFCYISKKLNLQGCIINKKQGTMAETCEELLRDIETLLIQFSGFVQQTAASNVPLVVRFSYYIRNATRNLFTQRRHMRHPWLHWNLKFELIVCSPELLDGPMKIDRDIDAKYRLSIVAMRDAVIAMLSDTVIDKESIKEQGLYEFAKSVQLFRMFLEIVIDPVKFDRLKKQEPHTLSLDGKSCGTTNLEGLEFWLPRYDKCSSLAVERPGVGPEPFYDYVRQVLKQCIDG